MGLGRFLYDNLVTDESMLYVSSLKTGIVTNALKNGTGSASMNTTGAYSGSQDLEYLCEIDSVTSGTEIGQATFKWSDGGGSWDATGVQTTSGATTLNNNVSVDWDSGAGDDFALADKWYFKGINLFNAGKLLDWNRDTRYRSADLESPNTIMVDFGSAQEVQALVIFDHNFTNGATITLKGNASSSWTSPTYEESVSFNADKIVHYPSSFQTFRYFQLEITDTANPDGYIEIGELFLGPYFEPDLNFDYGMQRNIETIQLSETSKYGIRKSTFFNHRKTFRLPYGSIPESQMDNIETMVEALGSRDTGIIQPVYVNENYNSPNDTWMADVFAMPRQHASPGRFATALELTEVLKSV